MRISSHKGSYSVEFCSSVFDELAGDLRERRCHLIIDERVKQIYSPSLDPLLKDQSVLTVEASEANKSLERVPRFVEQLISQGIKKGESLIALGGGITQDICCFIAAILFRGIDWQFYPTTLLAQADSCIGSKSSINLGEVKNTIGTFTPPRKVVVGSEFRETLDRVQIQSGVGEILKAFAIDGPETFSEIASQYDYIFREAELMQSAIQRALSIKKEFIEEDEFDIGRRNLFNYGHSFGHAIEAATKFQIPHGIAVTMGMDMANWLSPRLSVGSDKVYNTMHETLRKNYEDFLSVHIPTAKLLEALGKDKKNTTPTKLVLILPDQNSMISKFRLDNDHKFRDLVGEFIQTELVAKPVF